MKERPILFSGPMVRAILDGRKTQTRRRVKLTEISARSRAEQEKGQKFPYGKPGDRLWTQENHRIRLVDESSKTVECRYEEDGSTSTVRLTDREWEKMKARKHKVTESFGVLIPGRFMYRSLSRMVDEITAIRMERLQDISEADAVAEGIESTGDYWLGAKHSVKGTRKVHNDPITAYRDLWNSINGAESWNQNPWVWVIEFRNVSPI